MIVTLVCVIAAFVIFLEFVRPAYSDAQVIRGEVISRQNFLAQQEAAVAEVQQLIEKYKADAEVQQTVSKVIPSKPDVGDALYQINAIAQGYGINILSTTAQTPQLSIAKPAASASSTVGAVRPLGVATFQIRFSARYEDLKTFIDKLETNVRLMDITALNVTQPAAGTKSDALTVDLTIATYYQISQ